MKKKRLTKDEQRSTELPREQKIGLVRVLRICSNCQREDRKTVDDCHDCAFNFATFNPVEPIRNEDILEVYDLEFEVDENDIIESFDVQDIDLVGTTIQLNPL